MTNTTNLNLEKPAYADQVDVEAINRNMDKIDEFARSYVRIFTDSDWVTDPNYDADSGQVMIHISVAEHRFSTSATIVPDYYMMDNNGNYLYNTLRCMSFGLRQNTDGSIDLITNNSGTNRSGKVLLRAY